jgi:cation diffusion facilitator CzcD-associated flavoprotein CzcO
VATGQHHTPLIPQWPGGFPGDLLHSSSYRNPARSQGNKVLVVGSRSSGMEIAHDLATGGSRQSGAGRRHPTGSKRCHRATGYRRDLTAMVGHLDVLDGDGRPTAAGETAAAEGLRFFSYLSRPTLIGYFGRQSRRIAKKIAAELVSSR